MKQIVLTNLGKKVHLGEKNELEILHDITLTIDRGEMAAIAGRSGAGKTTLLNIIGGIDSYSSGSYLYNGSEMSEMSANLRSHFRNQKVGFVLQEFGLLMNKSVYDNVILPLIFSPLVKKRDIAEKAKRALSKVGLLEKMYEKVSELSGGQKQRVAIARAFINEQETILADEPTGALDSKTAQEIMDLFKELQQKGKTIILVTHDKKIAERCDRIINMEDGCLFGK